MTDDDDDGLYLCIEYYNIRNTYMDAGYSVIYHQSVR